MTLLAPGWLLVWLLAGPILLLHARRRRRLDVPSLRIWKLLESAGSRRPHLVRPPVSLLLLLQLAAVALAGLALAQPRLGGAAAVDHTVFLVDVSASMSAEAGGATRLAAARAELGQRIAALADEGRGLVSVIEVGTVANPVVARQSPASGRAALDRILSGHGGADWAGARRWVDTLARADESTLIVALSDGDMPLDGIDEVLRFGRPTANAGLAATVAATSPFAGVWRITGEVILWNRLVAPEGIGIRFTPAASEKGLDWGWIALDDSTAQPAADGTFRIPFSTETRFPGAGVLELSLLPDAAPHDDRIAFVLENGPRALEVLFVGEGQGPVARAIAALGAHILVAPSLPEKAGTFDLVVVEGGEIPSRPATNLLLLGDARIAGEDAPSTASEAWVTGWRTDHPLSPGINWGALSRVVAHPTQPVVGAVSVLEADGMPLVQARTLEHGREVRLALDPEASGWAAQPGFPTFFRNLADWIGVYPVALAAPCGAGRPCPLEAREGRARIVGPDGAEISNSGGGAFTASLAGLYRVERAEGLRLVAVHPDAAETALGEGGVAGVQGGILIRRWVLAALVLVLLAEAWVAGRGSERFLKSGALRRDSPQSGQRRIQLSARAVAVAAALAAILPLPVPAPGPDRALAAIGAQVPGAIELRSGAPASFQPAAAAAPPVGAVDVESALRLALAALPADLPGRVVLAGPLPTQGDLAAVSGQLRDAGLAVDWLPPGPAPQGDVRLRDIDVAPGLHLGDRVDIAALVEADADIRATVRLVVDGEPRDAVPAELKRGTNRVVVPFTASVAGTHLVELAVDAPGDPIPANNRTGVAVEVGAPPRVLVISDTYDWAQHFSGALAVQGVTTRILASRAAPRRLDDWLEHDLIVLMNVPALSIGIPSLESLAQAVRANGRGLLILGGENSFGPGGYFGTPLEDLSPLSAKVPHEAPLATVVFVIDRSGSMQAAVGDRTRLDIAKTATLSAAGLLDKGSKVGIVAFDQEGYEVLPLTESSDLAAVEAALKPLSPGGGTRLLPGLTMAIDYLEPAEAEIKHVIVMTDGLIEAADFGAEILRARAAGVTISTIAFGSSAITDRLAGIADAGGGKYHATQDFRALPSILAKETMDLADPPVKEEVTPVAWEDRSDGFLDGLPATLPPLHSHVVTTLQLGADLHLSILNGEGETAPLMASWHQGMGRVLAFAAHGAGSGTAEWLDRDDYPLIWGQIARQFLAAGEGRGLDVRLTRLGDEVRVTAGLLSPSGLPVTGAEVLARLGDGPHQRLTETAFGRYEGVLPLRALGPSEVRVAVAGLERIVPLHVGYWAALDPGRADAAAVRRVVAATGGAELESLASVQPPRTVWRPEARFRPWLVLALILFMAALLVRPVAGALVGRRSANNPPVVPAEPYVAASVADRRA